MAKSELKTTFRRTSFWGRLGRKVQTRWDESAYQWLVVAIHMWYANQFLAKF